MKKLVAALFLLPLLLTPSLAAPEPDEQARVQQAVQAYAAKQEAQRQKDIDQRLVNATDALVNDPASPVIGKPGAAVAVVEFFDYTCSYCKAVEPRLEAALKADRNVKLVLKEFPILTPQSLIAARVSLAAAKQGKYAAFHKSLMAYRGQLEADVIFDTAKSVGLDMARLKKDMDAPDVTNEIIANFNLARSLRIFQTPGFIVGGHMLSSESASIDFSKEIAAAHAR